MNRISIYRKDNKITMMFGYIFLTLLCFESAITFTELQPQGIAARILLVVEIIIFLFLLLSVQYTKKVLGSISLLMFIGVLSYFTSGYTHFLKAVMSAIAFCELNATKGFKYVFHTRLIFTIIINVLAIVGILNLGLISVGKSYGEVFGYGLGYDHPNRYAYTFFYLEIALVCWKNEKITKKDFFVIALFGAVGYLITKSRTLVIITALLILMIAGYNSKRFNKWIIWLMNKTSMIIYPFLSILSFVIPYVIANSGGTLAVFFSQFNQMMSARFTIISRVFEFYSLSLFGGVNEFSSLSQKYNYITVDNGYIRLLFEFGIIGTIAFMMLFILSIRKLIKQGNYIYIICTVVIAICGISENILIDSGFNISILFWGMLYNKKYSGNNSMLR